MLQLALISLQTTIHNTVQSVHALFIRRKVEKEPEFLPVLFRMMYILTKGIR